ncbi:MAG TPA: hypothetical protein ENI08_02340, partial [Candidatus Dependentiae bacterium]|nr:hypothetical protein [Candidatus Dependentiae bacterium]
MRKELVLLFFGFSFLCISDLCGHVSWIEEDPTVNIAETTHRIYRRYYSIARLEKAITMIRNLTDNNKQLASEILSIYKYDYDAVFLHHPLITSCVDAMNNNQDITPLLTFWDKLTAYKYIQDDLLIGEFIKLVFVIIKHVMICHNTVEKSVPAYFRSDYSLDALDLEQLLDAIDVACDVLSRSVSTYSLTSVI